MAASLLEKYRYYRRQNLMAARIILANPVCQGLMRIWAELVIRKHATAEGNEKGEL